MNRDRRSFGKGVLGVFAGLLGIPFVRGNKQGEVTGVVGSIKKWESVPDNRTREQYERDRKRFTLIEWTSVKDELPPDPDVVYLIRYEYYSDGGIAMAISNSRGDDIIHNARISIAYPTHWAPLPKM